jgi:hypothetical protein
MSLQATENPVTTKKCHAAHVSAGIHTSDTHSDAVPTLRLGVGVSIVGRRAHILQSQHALSHTVTRTCPHLDQCPSTGRRWRPRCWSVQPRRWRLPGSRPGWLQPTARPGQTTAQRTASRTRCPATSYRRAQVVDRETHGRGHWCPVQAAQHRQSPQRNTHTQAGSSSSSSSSSSEVPHSFSQTQRLPLQKVCTSERCGRVGPTSVLSPSTSPACTQDTDREELLTVTGAMDVQSLAPARWNRITPLDVPTAKAEGPTLPTQKAKYCPVVEKMTEGVPSNHVPAGPGPPKLRNQDRVRVSLRQHSNHRGTCPKTHARRDDSDKTHEAHCRSTIPPAGCSLRPLAASNKDLAACSLRLQEGLTCTQCPAMCCCPYRG